MSLSSTSFMAAPGIFDSSLDKIDCSDILSAILLKDTATLGQIPIKGKATNIEHKFIEDKLNAVSITAKMAASTKLTVITPSTTTSLAVIARTGAILYPEGKEWYIRLGAALTHDTSVNVSVYASSGWTTITSTTTFYVVQMPKSDLATASEDISKARVVRKNFTQVFERAIEVAETRKHIDVWAVPNEVEHQTTHRTYEIKRELNTAVLLGFPKTVSGSYSADSELRTMAGLFKLIRDPDLDKTNEDTCVVNAANASLSVDMLNSLCNLIFTQGGLDEKSKPIFIMGAVQKRRFSALDKSYRRDVTDSMQGNVGYHRDSFVSDLTGDSIPVIVDRWMRSDAIILCDKSRTSIVPLQGDQWHVEKMSKTGRTEKWQLSGQYTLEVRNAEEAHGLIYNLDYT